MGTNFPTNTRRAPTLQIGSSSRSSQTCLLLAMTITLREHTLAPASPADICFPSVVTSYRVFLTVAVTKGSQRVPAPSVSVWNPAVPPAPSRGSLHRLRAAPAGPPPALGSPFTRLLFLEEFRARPPHSSSAVLQVRALSGRHRPTACQKRAPSARPKPAGRGMRGSRPTCGLRAAAPPRPNETPTRFSRPSIACELQTRQLSTP